MRSLKKRGYAFWLKRLLLGLAVIRVAAYLALFPAVADAQAHPTRYPVCCTTPADLGLKYQDVTFTSDDGVTSSGWYIPSQNEAAVILLHGYGTNRVAMLSRAQVLAGHGYGTLLYDLRAHGKSGGDAFGFGWLEVGDVAAALAFLQGREEVDPERIGILGFSIGGQIALRAASEMDGIRGVVADGPSLANCQDVPPPSSMGERWRAWETCFSFKNTEWRLGISAPRAVVEAIADIAPRPILLISTGRGVERRMCRHYADRAGDPKSLWEIPEAGHGGGLAARPDEYEGRLVAFFDGALLADRTSE